MEKPKSISGKIYIYTRYFGFFMVAVYLCVGIIVIIKRHVLGYLNDDACLILGILMIGYGIFRGYRAFRTAKDENAD